MKFDNAFEEKIIQTLLVDNDFAQQMVEVLEPDLFNLVHTQQISKILKNYHEKYDCFPSVELLVSMCKEIEDILKQKKCVDFLNNIRKNPLNGDIDYVKDKSLEYFRIQHIANTINDEVLPRIAGDGKLEDILPIIEKAMNRGTSKDLGYQYELDQEARFIDKPEKVVPTPWEYLNKLMKGGFGEKRLITILAPSGIGKTHFLVNIGKGALLTPKPDGTGRIVAHYTLELDVVETARRYDASITEVQINDVSGNKEKILFELKQQLPNGAKLIIKEYPMKQATIQTIKAHLTQLRLNGIVPDLIIIDYGDLLRAVQYDKEKRNNLEAVWIDMKSLAQVLSIPVVTATQTNRGGYNKDLIMPDDISEDFSKVMHSDVILTMARNLAQKIAGVGKMYLAKNRQGFDGIVIAYAINTAMSLIEVFELTEETEKEYFQPSETKTQTKLKESIQGFLDHKDAKDKLKKGKLN